MCTDIVEESISDEERATDDFVRQERATDDFIREPLYFAGEASGNQFAVAGGTEKKEKNEERGHHHGRGTNSRGEENRAKVEAPQAEQHWWYASHHTQANFQKDSVKNHEGN